MDTDLIIKQGKTIWSDTTANWTTSYNRLAKFLGTSNTDRLLTLSAGYLDTYGDEIDLVSVIGDYLTNLITRSIHVIGGDSNASQLEASVVIS